MIRMAATFVIIVSLIFAVVSCSEDSTSAKDSGPSDIYIVTPWDDTTRDGIVEVLVSADDEDEIEKVELYVAGSLYGTDSTEPYEFQWDMSPLADGSSTSVYATAVDGYGNETSSAVVTVKKGENDAPVATITSPDDGITILQDQEITLSGTATDTEDGDLGESSITWSSNLQSVLEIGENGEFTGLCIGDHVLTMTALDNDAIKGTASVIVTVEENASNDYAYIPAGKYYIGQPAFKKSAVTLTRSFWMAKTEMTIKELAAAMVEVYGDDFVDDFIDDRNDDLYDDGDGLYPAIYGYDPDLDENKLDNLTYKDYPAVFLTYKEVIDACNALNVRDGYDPAYDVQKKSITFIKGANGWRLPTEAEWEVAARCGASGKKYPWGDGSPRGLCNTMSEQNLNDPIVIFNGHGPVPVKSYDPNAFGLYDMAGNVAEMCSDIFVGSVPGGTDPVGVTQEKQPRYVAKGGCWYGYGDETQICMHVLTLPYNDKDKDKYNSGIGLRLVRNVE